MMTSELTSTVNSLQEALLLCRPRDPLTFAARYFSDEKLDNSEEAHATHSLPFLIYHQHEFRSAACTIFCQLITNGNAGKDFLDGCTVLDIVKSINLGSIWFDVSAIDEVVSENFSSLKRIDFNLFVIAMRFPISCYQVVFWLKDEVVDFYSSQCLVSGIVVTASQSTTTVGGNSTTTNKLKQLIDSTNKDTAIELNKFKVFVQQRYRSVGATGSPVSKSSSSAAVRSSSETACTTRRLNSSGSGTCYHMHRDQSTGWAESDAKQWSRALVSCIEDMTSSMPGGAAAASKQTTTVPTATIEELANAFVTTFLSYSSA